MRDQLGYHVEKNLSQRHGKRQLMRVGIVIPDLSQSFYDGVIAGIQAAAGDIQVVVYEAPTSEKTHQLFDEPVDGLIFCEPHMATQQLKNWGEAAQVLVIVVNSQASLEDSDVWIDWHQVGKLAADYLLANGHREIAVVLPVGHQATNPNVIAGFKEGLNEYHVTLPDEALYTTIPTLAAGYNLTRQVRFRHYTAIFAVSDELAIGIMRGLVSIGKRLPMDQSVLGVGNLEIDDYVSPKLSSINIAASNIGRAAFDKLEELAKNPQTAHELLTLPLDITKRFSIKHI